MNENKNPGIFFHGIDLLGCSISQGVPAADLRYNLELIKLDRVYPSEGEMTVSAAFDLFAGIKDSRLSFKCEFAALYKRVPDAELTWTDIVDPHAVAHIIPYLREFASNITWRMPLPRLILPTVNTYKLVEDYKKTMETEKKRPAKPTRRAAPSKK